MAQHKIQSSTGLTLELDQVPKRLGCLTQEWAPHACVVSFKLETDTTILFDKATAALRNYGVHLVVANLLHNRENVCYLMSLRNSKHKSEDSFGVTTGNSINIVCILYINFTIPLECLLYIFIVLYFTRLSV